MNRSQCVETCGGKDVGVCRETFRKMTHQPVTPARAGDLLDDAIRGYYTIAVEDEISVLHRIHSSVIQQQ